MIVGVASIGKEITRGLLRKSATFVIGACSDLNARRRLFPNILKTAFGDSRYGFNRQLLPIGAADET